MIKKIIITFVFVGLLLGTYQAYQMYQNVYQPNVSLKTGKTAFFYIPTGSSFKDVVNKLYEKGYIINRVSFQWLANKKANFKNHIHPGKYLIKQGMNNNELINLLRSGNQVMVKVTFNNVKIISELSNKITKNLECDSLTFYQLITNKKFIHKYGFNSSSILTMFLPNTYEFYWNTSAEQLFKRMAKEYKKFWTSERKAKAKKIGLSQSEVSILASIVQAEQSVHSDERPKVAGLYINRLKKKMLLQSDPTVIYGIGDFTIRRVLNKHKEKDTPYNTYLHVGLPPGPINLPSIKSLDAVLNYQHHNYLYMCAKDNFSGYHNFSKTYRQHLIYARKYQQELNKRRIYN